MWIKPATVNHDYDGIFANSEDAIVSIPGKYTLFVTDTVNGCINSDSVDVLLGDPSKAKNILDWKKVDDKKIRKKYVLGWSYRSVI